MSLEQLIRGLKKDSWREEVPFSPDLQECQEVLFDPSKSRAEKQNALCEWLASRNQPCLFGRVAANREYLTVCILTEGDVFRGDPHVRDVIQESRNIWKYKALRGEQHGFIILLVSKHVAWAQPSTALLQVALQLCRLYLNLSDADRKFHDQVHLSYTLGDAKYSRQWKVGVNVFGSQADKRWWHDHRIPGGLGFSMNSVGHMSLQMAIRAIHKDAEIAAETKDWGSDQLVRWALPLAMRTILTASAAETSGCKYPGTHLDPCDLAELSERIVPENRKRILKDLHAYSENHYSGWYDTDVTVPTEYFDSSILRPSEMKRLLFTYLHQDSDEDYLSMGIGNKICNVLNIIGSEEGSS